MNLLCRIFGHKMPPPHHYGALRGKLVDGINVIHASVYVDCPRCGNAFQCAKVHLGKYTPAPRVSE